MKTIFLKNTQIVVVLFFLFCGNLIAQNSSENKLAFEYFNQQEYEKALVLFEKLYNNSPTAINYDYYLQCLIRVSKLKDAEKLIKKQIKNQPNIDKYQVDLGYIFHLQGEENKAKKQYETCIVNLKPNNISDLANAFMTYNLSNYVIKTYQQGRKILSKEDIYAMELALFYQNMNQYEKACQEYLQLLKNQEEKLKEVEAALLTWWLNDENGAKREILRTNLLKSLSKYPDNKAYSNLMIWFAMQEKDFSLALKQAKAFDKRYQMNGMKVLQIANYAFENKDYNTAIAAYDYILSQKDASPFHEEVLIYKLTTMLILTENSSTKQGINVEKVNKDLTQYFAQHAVTNQNLALYRKWILWKAIKFNELNSSVLALEQMIENKTIGEREQNLLKIDLADLKILQGDVWEATLLYSQVEKAIPNDTLAHLAKLSNAKLSLLMGEFEWANAQLDVLKAATSKYIANDAMYLSLLITDNLKEEDSLNIALKQFANALFLIEHQKAEEALIFLDSIDNQTIYSPLNDDVLFQKAKIATIMGNYPLADSLYSELIANYSFDLLADDALFERASLQEFYLKDNVMAMQLYQKLITDYPDSIYTIEARKRYRILRGDVLGL